MSLDKTIAALVPDWPELPPAERAEVTKSCIAFVRAQLALAPFHIRLGFRVLFMAYSLYLPFRAGPLQSPDTRARALTAFSALPLLLVGGLERLLRASTMLAFFDHPSVLKVLNEQAPSERQQSFRTVRAAQMDRVP